MTKTLLILSSMFMSATAMLADTALVLQKTNGEEISFLIGNNPVAVPEASTLHITSSDNDITVNYDDIQKFYFNGVTGINEIISTAKTAFQLTGNEITATGMKAGSDMCIYSLNGTLVATAKASDNGIGVISISELAKGSYIIKAGNNSFKFLKR